MERKSVLILLVDQIILGTNALCVYNCLVVKTLLDLALVS